MHLAVLVGDGAGESTDGSPKEHPLTRLDAVIFFGLVASLSPARCSSIPEYVVQEVFRSSAADQHGHRVVVGLKDRPQDAMQQDSFRNGATVEGVPIMFAE